LKKERRRPQMGIAPLIGWPAHGRRARSVFLPSPVLYPVHKSPERPARGRGPVLNKGNPRAQTGHGPFIGWSVRVRRAHSTLLPSPVLYPIHKIFKRAVRWPVAKVHSPFAEAFFSLILAMSVRRSGHDRMNLCQNVGNAKCIVGI
jgi:hypothetical protein